MSRKHRKPFDWPTVYKGRRGTLALIRLFDPFVNFVQFVAIEIRIGLILVCSQTSGQIRLMSEMHRSRRATHPSHDGLVVRKSGRSRLFT